MLSIRMVYTYYCFSSLSWPTNRPTILDFYFLFFFGVGVIHVCIFIFCFLYFSIASSAECIRAPSVRAPFAASPASNLWPLVEQKKFSCFEYLAPSRAKKYLVVRIFGPLLVKKSCSMPFRQLLPTISSTNSEADS